jgi:uncharacterized protein YydD (DUF2326 family)
MNGQSIKVNSKDIFDYIIGRSSYDPIERQIDPTRYEVRSDSIYDKFLKKTFEQDECFSIFYKKVKELRFVSKEIEAKEIGNISVELEQLAPTLINL